ncbi:MAG: citramalate synthase [Phycisphaeraceae bacterium]|nr:citramalate synthase [Phycisphaeraceae bacterium]
MPVSPRIELYDTTLRDGAQGEGVNFSLVDKVNIARRLDEFGVDYVEGGYPLSNPKDEALFSEIAASPLRHAKLCAFGMTRRRGVAAADDPGMKALRAAKSPVITIVGKTWDLHVDEVLGVSRSENLAMIHESLAFCGADAEVFYDAEHFFDGFRANRDFALSTLRAALDGGATRLILCDTNGGSLPPWIDQVVRDVRTALDDEVRLGIHTHNDSGLAAACAMAAVEAGCTQVQGTVNGIGERCGNCDLTTMAANLRLKMDRDCLSADAVTRLTDLSRYVYERANMNLVVGQPFVGPAAFAHKGGMHVHAVQRVAHSYEHVEPGSVGNRRRVLVSELSGASNIAAVLGEKYDLESDKALQRQVLGRVVDLEHRGFQFEAAPASLELLVHEARGTRTKFWDLDHYRCVILKRGEEPAVTEAIVKVAVDGAVEHQVAEGDGPVNALDGALRKCLRPHFPQLDRVHLRDFKVRVVNPTAESAAKVRVISEFAVDQGRDWFATVGVDENIVDASWQALADAFEYFLIEVGGGKT